MAWSCRSTQSDIACRRGTGQRYAFVPNGTNRHRFRELHPFELQVSLMNACNLNCRYCRCPEIATRTMNTEQWSEIIEGVARLGATRIKFQGGPRCARTFAN